MPYLQERQRPDFNPAILLLWVAIFLVYLLLSGCQEKTESTPATSSTSSTLMEGGADLFSRQCASCHGAKGAGGVIGPALARSEFTYGKTRSAIMESIRNGRPNGMPAFGATLTDEEIKDLATYVLSL